MKTLKNLLFESYSFLQENQVKDVRFSVDEIVAYVLACSRLDLYLHFDMQVEEKELFAIEKLLLRRAKKEPLNYILQKTTFYGCQIHLTSDVLIPRPETEILVDYVAKNIKNSLFQKKVLWDICCGSGCIGIALKKKFPELKVYLSDISEKAIQVAKKNATENEVDVIFYKGDLLKPFFGQKADFVVSNPPYVSKEEYLSLDEDVVRYEPELALVAENEGVGFYERFSQEIYSYLNPRGKVFFEMGYNQGEILKNIFFQNYWIHKKIISDWAGHDRFFFLEIE